MLLVLGLTTVLLALLVLVVDVSVLLLAQRGVASAADGAAVAAAQGLDQDALRSHGLGGRVPLGEVEVQRAVASYAGLVQPPTALTASREPDGTTVVVRAERVVHLPFAGVVGKDRVTVRAVARARSPVAP
ncbi:MAG: hypothetical protein JWN17_1246 [Frankiales bacterium]|nr:hypothetical protein [Frankiales bacterium]